jgi:hypothetical protein
MRPPHTYREFVRAGALFLSTPTIMFFSLTILLIEVGYDLLVAAVVGLWTLVLLAIIVTVIYRVETSRRLQRWRQSLT